MDVTPDIDNHIELPLELSMNEAYDTLDISELETESLSCSELTLESSNLTSMNDVVETESLNRSFGMYSVLYWNFHLKQCSIMHLCAGSADDPIELNTDTSSIITEPTLVTVAPANDLPDASIMPENSVKIDNRLPSENKDTSPWKIDVQRHRGCDDVDIFVPSSDSSAKKQLLCFLLEALHKIATSSTNSS